MSNMEFLSIGSVVSLIDGTKKLMVIGFLGIDEDNDKTYDYIGCLYPEGFLDGSNMLLFNHDQIEKVYFDGYTDDEDKQFKASLNSIKEELFEKDIEIIDVDSIKSE